MSLQQYNSRLQSDLETVNEAHKRLETEKATIVESLSNVRGHNKALQDQLVSLKVSCINIYIFSHAMKCLMMFCQWRVLFREFFLLILKNI